MVISEPRRRRLHANVARTMGTETADMLIDELPPVAWTDMATKQDLTNLEIRLGGEISGVRSEMMGLRAEVMGELATLRGETAQGMARMVRMLVFSMMGMWIATLGAVGGLFAATGH